MTRSNKIVEGAIPTLVVEVGDKELEVDEGVVNVNENGYFVVSEESETLDKLRSNDNEQVGGWCK